MRHEGLSIEKRRKILEVAAELFGRLPYGQVHMDRIATAAGVGKGTIYRYFPTKDKLFHLLVRPGAPMPVDLSEVVATLRAVADQLESHLRKVA